jgi:hypothetical protein
MKSKVGQLNVLSHALSSDRYKEWSLDDFSGPKKAVWLFVVIPKVLAWANKWI